MQIVLSALGPSIAEQVAAMGLEQTGASLESIDRMAHAITLLHIQGALTDAETTRARTRIIKKLKLRKAMSNTKLRKEY